MTLTRIVSISAALVVASTLIACNTAPAMPMGAPAANSMASPERMAAMDAQMKTMHEMHTKMMNAKTPEERQAMMGEHMKAMQGGMGVMKGMGGMGGMGDAKAMPPEMAQHHKMMQMMMDMMAQRMPMPAAKP